MKSTKAAIRYAKALLEMSIEQKVLDPVLHDMSRIMTMAQTSQDFVSFLNSPIIKADKKIKIINALIVDLQPLSAGFISLIVKNGRSAMLPFIASGYSSLLEKHRGIVSGTITSAVALDNDTRKKIIDKLSMHNDKVSERLINIGKGRPEGVVIKGIDRNKTFAGELRLVEKIDPALIGGFIITIGDKQIDSSVASKLKNLRQELTN